jgi:hypothetical protein
MVENKQKLFGVEIEDLSSMNIMMKKLVKLKLVFGAE